MTGSNCEIPTIIRKFWKSRFSHTMFINPLQYYTASTLAYNLLYAHCRITMVLSIKYNITSVMCNG